MELWFFRRKSKNIRMKNLAFDLMIEMKSRMGEHWTTFLILVFGYLLSTKNREIYHKFQYPLKIAFLSMHFISFLSMHLTFFVFFFCSIYFHSYSVADQIFASYLQFCGIGLRNAQLYEKSQLEVKRNQVLLDLARMIFEEQSTIEHMVLRILTHMQSLIQCQRVQVSNKSKFARKWKSNDLVYDGKLINNSMWWFGIRFA